MLSDLPVVEFEDVPVVVLDILDGLAAEPRIDVGGQNFHNTMSDVVEDGKVDSAEPQLAQDFKLFNRAMETALPESNEHHSI